MKNILEQFKKVAPFIVTSVKARITAEMTDEAIMSVIHDEIVAFFNKQQQMTTEYLTFDANERAAFASAMYELLAPMAEVFKEAANPEYAAYVAKTGKTGALNFITNA